MGNFHPLLLHQQTLNHYFRGKCQHSNERDKAESQQMEGENEQGACMELIRLMGGVASSSLCLEICINFTNFAPLPKNFRLKLSRERSD